MDFSRLIRKAKTKHCEASSEQRVIWENNLNCFPRSCLPESEVWRERKSLITEIDVNIFRWKSELLPANAIHIFCCLRACSNNHFIDCGKALFAGELSAVTCVRLKGPTMLQFWDRNLWNRDSVNGNKKMIEFFRFCLSFVKGINADINAVL